MVHTLELPILVEQLVLISTYSVAPSGFTSRNGMAKTTLTDSPSAMTMGSWRSSVISIWPLSYTLPSNSS